MKLQDLFENHPVAIELDEVSMTPGALKDFALTPQAQNMTIGFEAEMCVPNLESEDQEDLDPEPDFSQDEYISASDPSRDIMRFFLGGDSVHSRREIQTAIDEFYEKFHEWTAEKFSDEVESNPEELRRRIQDEDKDLSDEEIDIAIRTRNRTYDDAWDQWRDEWEQDISFDDFMEEYGCTHMSDFSRKFELHWPYYTYPASNQGGGTSFSELADSFEIKTGYSATGGSSYHGTKRRPNLWIFEPDSSIRPDNHNDGGVELVSPPLPFQDGWAALDNFADWAVTVGAYANDSCGFHVGVSMPLDIQQNLDPVKLIILLGDQKVLEDFGRMSNTYTQSSFAMMKSKIDSSSFELLADIKDSLKNKITHDSQSIASILLGNQGKYVSVNIHGTYVEFRSAGGNYFEKWATIEESVLRYMRALSLACDPQAERQEYLKKLGKLLAAAYSPGSPESLFAQYVAGSISKDEFKSKLEQRKRKDKPERLPE